MAKLLKPAVGAQPAADAHIDADIADARVRIVCTIPNAPALINGITFATVPFSDGPVHVSERVDPARVERILTIEGYALWAGDEPAHARSIEDALEAARRAVPPQGGPSIEDRNVARQLAEQQENNRLLAADLQKERERAARLAEENRRLREENEQLKAAGYQPAAA